MKRYLILAAASSVLMATQASASHVNHTDEPFASRGDCESMNADLRSDDREMLQVAFPQFFSSDGEVESFLTKAMKCEFNSSDGNWYITNHIEEVLASEWFLRRQ